MSAALAALLLLLPAAAPPAKKPAPPPPDPAEVRARALADLRVAFPAVVFAGDRFPEPAFADPAKAAGLLGPHTLRVRFHGADFDAVPAAAKPGPYGAVIEATPKSGPPMRRLVTLFRLPGAAPPPEAKFPDAAAIARLAGIDPSVAERQADLVRSVVRDRAFAELAADPAFARLLAGLWGAESGDRPVGKHDDALGRDRQWWVTLKRKLDGTATLFPRPVNAPTLFAGKPAPVVHEGTPDEAAVRPDTAAKLDAVLSEAAAGCDEPFAVCVVRNGVTVLHKAYGTRDGRPMTVTDKTWMAGVTKPLSATLMMMLIDRGLVSPDDPVEKFLPRFRGRGSATPDTPMTVRHLLTHTAGMAPFPLQSDAENDLDDRLADALPGIKVGRVWAYNRASFALAGKIVEAVSGEALPAFYRNHLLAPLEMTRTDVTGTHADSRSVPLDIARWGQMLLNRGAYGNLRFFSEKTFAHMLPQPAPAKMPDGRVRNYGMGLDGRPEAFGHGAASGAIFRVDVAARLVVVVTRNKYDPKWEKFNGRFFKTLTDGLLPLPAAAAGGWDRFRGPNGSGVAAAASAPVSWTDKDYDWQVRIPGIGHSSPVVWGNRVFVTTGDETAGGRRTTLCLDAADGRTLWTHEFDRTTYTTLRTNSLATSTPAVDADRVYVCWVTPEAYEVLALTHDGKQVWRTGLGPFPSDQGFAASPVVVGGVVVLSYIPDGPGAIVGLDAATGRKRWSLPRKAAATEYGTPCVFTRADGSAEVVTVGRATGMTAIDPATGRVNWEFALAGEGGRGGAISSPIAAGGLVIGSAGGHVVAVRPPAQPGGKPVEAWRIPRAAPIIPTVLAAGDRVYAWNDSGIVTCAELAGGKVLWRERIGGTFWGSPIAVGGHLYCLSDTGECVVLPAGDAYRPPTRIALGEGTYCTPAVAPGGRLLLRTESRLVSVGGRRD
jgi:CubicO group peptidase (beta-lactamase class C family)/outer membrane protein assembly factor BamB